MSYLISLHPLLFENIAHVRSICKFDLNCICVFVYLYFCICMSETWEHCFRSPLTITFSKIYHLIGLSDHLTQTVFVYLCICICVFASQTPRNIVFEVLLLLPFQKYSTCHVYLQLWPMLYLRISVFVLVYLQVRHPGTLFLRSLYHHLSENIRFVWSKTSYLSLIHIWRCRRRLRCRSRWSPYH